MKTAAGIQVSISEYHHASGVLYSAESKHTPSVQRYAVVQEVNEVLTFEWLVGSPHKVIQSFRQDVQATIDDERTFPYISLGADQPAALDQVLAAKHLNINLKLIYPYLDYF